MACCRRALELKPDFAEAHNNLGLVLREQGRPDEAVACYRRAVELKPDYVETHNNLGNALKDRGKLLAEEGVDRDRVTFVAHETRPSICGTTMASTLDWIQFRTTGTRPAWTRFGWACRS